MYYHYWLLVDLLDTSSRLNRSVSISTAAACLTPRLARRKTTPCPDSLMQSATIADAAAASAAVVVVVVARFDRLNLA